MPTTAIRPVPGRPTTIISPVPGRPTTTIRPVQGMPTTAIRPAPERGSRVSWAFETFVLKFICKLSQHIKHQLNGALLEIHDN